MQRQHSRSVGPWHILMMGRSRSEALTCAETAPVTLIQSPPMSNTLGTALLEVLVPSATAAAAAIIAGTTRGNMVADGIGCGWYGRLW